MSYDKSKIVTVGGLKQLSVKVKSTQDVLSRCIFLGNSSDAEVVSDVASQTITDTDNNVAVMSVSDGVPLTVNQSIVDESSLITDVIIDQLSYEGCQYVDGGFSYITSELIVMNLRVSTTTETNRFFVTGLPAPRNVNNSLAYVPVSLFYAPSVYGGGYVQINTDTNEGELVLSFSANLPIGTDIMVSAMYLSN